MIARSRRGEASYSAIVVEDRDATERATRIDRQDILTSYRHPPQLLKERPLKQGPRQNASDIVPDSEHHQEQEKGHSYPHRVLLEPQTKWSTAKKLKGEED